MCERYRVCEKRVRENEYGVNMCTAIGCCELGDMPCECVVCNRKCDKPFAMQCYRVKCRAEDGGEHFVGVMTTDREAAMKSAVKTLKEGRHIETVAVGCEEVEAI